jgi:hypothetical protein
MYPLYCTTAATHPATVVIQRPCSSQKKFLIQIFHFIVEFKTNSACQNAKVKKLHQSDLSMDEVSINSRIFHIRTGFVM